LPFLEEGKERERECVCVRERERRTTTRKKELAQLVSFQQGPRGPASCLAYGSEFMSTLYVHHELIAASCCSRMLSSPRFFASCAVPPFYGSPRVCHQTGSVTARHARIDCQLPSMLSPIVPLFRTASLVVRCSLLLWLRTSCFTSWYTLPSAKRGAHFSVKVTILTLGVFMHISIYTCILQEDDGLIQEGFREPNWSTLPINTISLIRRLLLCLKVWRLPIFHAPPDYRFLQAKHKGLGRMQRIGSWIGPR
jgi:hypothetical protein